MGNFLVIGCIITTLYFFIQFARQEQIQEFFEDTIDDVEGRLEWARTRRYFPFGMKAQLRVSRELLIEAKCLWKENKWYQAYRAALQSQEAMDKAQRLYSAGINRSANT